MIQVRFDEQSRSRLVLIWEDAVDDRATATLDRAPETDGRAANLLFSILDRGGDRQIGVSAPVQPQLAKPRAPRRRKPRAIRSKPH